MILKLLTLILLANLNIASYIPDGDSTDSALQDKISRLTSELEKFSTTYLTNLEQKITTIITTVNSLDANIKALIEKAHVWDLYRHHIDAWDDHMKSLDHKIDLIKYNQDDTKIIETKLTSLEFLMNHILSKMMMEGDGKSNYKDGKGKSQEMEEILKKLKENKNNQNEISSRLNNILRHILTVENSSCKMSSKKNADSKSAKLMEPVGRDYTTILRGIEAKLNEFIVNLSPKDLKQFASAGRKNTKSLEDILEQVIKIDDRTIRLFDAEAQHSTKFLKCCQSTSNELSTFTESSDLLLKRIENLVLNIQEKVDKVVSKNNSVFGTSDDQVGHKIDSENNIDNVTDVNVIETNSTELVISAPVTSSTEIDTQEEFESRESQEIDFVQPSKFGCHDLTVRIDGVYKFSGNTEPNDAGRDFNERYCAFPTDGVGWTVIQRRGAYDYQENFNRSWIEYKNGFGSLAKDFWFGNEYIHKLVYKDSYELRIELEDFNDVQVWAEYSIFQIDSEKYNYNLLIGGYRGAIPDSMLYHHNQDFSTYDRRNDKSIDLCCPCAIGYGSGWWFDNCSEANLNGIYHNTPDGHNYVGVVWENWRGDYSLKKTRMLIRPKTYNNESNENVHEEFPDDP